MHRRLTIKIIIAYAAKDIANKFVYMAQDDVANGGDAMTNLKLQKLLYYEQGYHLAFFNEPLFNESIEAWMYGPVVPEVYDTFKDNGSTALSFEGEPLELSDDEEDLFRQVYDAFRDYSAIGLMNRTHSEPTWQNAKPTGKGTVISIDSMKSFFKTQLS